MSLPFSIFGTPPNGEAMVRAIAVFFACTTAALAAFALLPIAPQFVRANQQTPSDEDIIFPAKLFGGNKAWVFAKGTLSADWTAYKNNTYSILCVPDQCIVASVAQIGPKAGQQCRRPSNVFSKTLNRQ